MSVRHAPAVPVPPEERAAYARAAHRPDPIIGDALRRAGDAGRIAVAVAAASHVAGGGTACVLLYDPGERAEVLSQHDLAERVGASHRRARFIEAVPDGRVRVAVAVARWGRILWADVPATWGQRLEESRR